MKFDMVDVLHTEERDDHQHLGTTGPHSHVPRFTDIWVSDSPRGEFRGKDNGLNFQANWQLFLIHHAWMVGCDFEDLADGYGSGQGTHGDWSGIRDSSDKAIERMLERSLNFLFG